MDDLIYTAMTGALAAMARQDAVTHNLANASTNGFQADLMSFRAVPASAAGTATTRVYALEASAGFDANPGPVSTTGNPLDVAIRGAGWFAVQAADGSEAYTRAGSFTLSAEGALQTQTGRPVIGEGGPLTLPPNAEVSIGSDGTVSARSGKNPPVTVGKLKLVNPNPAELTKGADGLLRLPAGETASDDPAVRVVQGSIEGSNVNVVEAMVQMIDVSRQFEMQMKLLDLANTNDQRASQLLALHA